VFLLIMVVDGILIQQRGSFCRELVKENKGTYKGAGKQRRVINMMRRWLLMSWVWTVTMGLIGLIVLTHPLKPAIASPSPMATAGIPGCKLFMVTDVSNCGGWLKVVANCKAINSAPGAGNSTQCVMCQLGQLVIYGVQKVLKVWYDCNGDGVADCLLIWEWALPKGCQSAPGGSGGSGGSYGLEPFAEETECACPYELSEPGV